MAIGPDCMVTGLCGLLSVATQTDAEQLYDAIIALRQAQDAAAAAGPEDDSGALCLALSTRADSTACTRSAGHRGNHRDAQGHQWRNASPGAGSVPESVTATA